MCHLLIISDEEFYWELPSKVGTRWMPPVTWVGPIFCDLLPEVPGFPCVILSCTQLPMIPIWPSSGSSLFSGRNYQRPLFPGLWPSLLSLPQTQLHPPQPPSKLLTLDPISHHVQYHWSYPPTGGGGVLRMSGPHPILSPTRQQE